MTMLQVVAAVATTAAFVVTTGILSYKYGKRIARREEIHDELMEGHKSMHRDVQRLSEQVNGNIINHRSQCSVCDVESDEVSTTIS